jgi:hypothetical protein
MHVWRLKHFVYAFLLFMWVANVRNYGPLLILVVKDRAFSYYEKRSSDTSYIFYHMLLIFIDMHSTQCDFLHIFHIYYYLLDLYVKFYHSIISVQDTLQMMPSLIADHCPYIQIGHY